MIGTRVKELRKRDRLSQDELGKKLGVVKQTISAWETDKYDPDYATIKKVANFFGVTVDYLTGISDDIPNVVQVASSISDVDKAVLDLINSAENKDMLIKLIEVYNRLDADHQYVLIGDAAKMAIESKPVADGRTLGTGTLGKL